MEKIESAVQNALTSDKKYENVGVLSLRWVNDDLNLGQIETELLDTFKTTFNYATESYIIPATSYNAAATGVKRKLGSFMAKYDNASSLAIVIYQGHSHYAQHGIVPQQLVLL